MYSIGTADVRDGPLGKLVVCPFQLDSRGDTNYTNLGSNLDSQVEMESSNQLVQYFNQPTNLSVESLQIPAQLASTTKKAQRSCNFTAEEDNLLVSGWLNINLDIMHINEQKSKSFWGRIYEYFHKYKKFPSNRSSISLKTRWSSIKLAVNKFCECYAQIEVRQQSGVSEHNKILQAKLMYREMQHTSFQFEHCWNALRYQPKWLEIGKKKRAKKSSSLSPRASSPFTTGSINSWEDDAQDDTFVDSKRPLGEKVEEERFKKQRNTERVDDNSIAVLIEETKVEKKEMNDKKMDFIERRYVQELERLSIQQMQLRMEQEKDEERIMSLDTTGMLPLQAEYYKLRQKEILDKRSGFESSMDDEKDAFYVVRKGDIVGVYKSLSDCQAQLGSSVCNPSVSVFKGFCLPKEAEEYLKSHGLKGGTYSIGAADVQEDLFGELVACPFQQPICSKGKAFDSFDKNSPEKRRLHVLESGNIPGWVGSTSVSANAQRNLVRLDNYIEVPPISSKCLSCTLEFDGASKGNPGPAGAGAVLRAEDGSLVCRLREGVGIATNNVAEYRGVILGLKYALNKGFKHICVQGDSKLVCMQIQGLWKTKNQNMADLCKLAKELVDKFVSFQIRHIERDFNSDADAQANLGVLLKNGEVQEEHDEYKRF
ncbi:hypothetical protein F0562_004981 [Nyssa sinensis]|uniref:RNase H type-1 domain-containing protein n=1 Tax=Nyssa sinensis TaxID=561372 RepID=A0A5J5AKG1_9ASTE|nr:hypothetical protein F0562_004981 [Nyssa sinensis]